MNFNAKRGIILPLSVPPPHLAPRLSLGSSNRPHICCTLANVATNVDYAVFKQTSSISFCLTTCDVALSLKSWTHLVH